MIDDEEPFQVVCVRAGVTLTVPPERSILSVARERGIHVISWCPRVSAAPARPRCSRVSPTTATAC